LEACSGAGRDTDSNWWGRVQYVVHPEVAAIMEGDINSGVTEPTSSMMTAGMVLVPIVGLLIVLELVMTGTQIWHFAHSPLYPAHLNGITPKRRFGSILYFCIVWLIPVLVVAFLWFDPIGSGMNRRSRLAMIGFIGAVVTLMSLVLMLAGWNHPYV